MNYHNRCIAINKNNKKCRVKTKNNELFCCESHYPINKELTTEGCFICNEQINKSNDILYFNCKHAFHKQCYKEWLQYSTYEKPICLLCRKDIFQHTVNKTEKKKLNKITDIHPLIEISHTLNKSPYYHFNHITNINLFSYIKPNK
jgi:hypothetical protein